ncbi:rod shape-determining protein MreC, partial [Streptomyces griseus]
APLVPGPGPGAGRRAPDGQPPLGKLDIVGVVVQAPREDPRDTVLPKKPAQAKPKPTPTVTVTVQPNGDLVDGSGKVVGNINEQAGGDAAGAADGDQQGDAQPDNAANDQE